jgi:hypothetical protein
MLWPIGLSLALGQEAEIQECHPPAASHTDTAARASNICSSSCTGHLEEHASTCRADLLQPSHVSTRICNFVNMLMHGCSLAPSGTLPMSHFENGSGRAKYKKLHEEVSEKRRKKKQWI